MQKPGIGARLRYRFDNIMARGNASVIALLGLVSLLWVLAIGVIVWLFSIRPAGQDERYGFIEGTWRS